MRVVSIIGHKNAGKTTLLVALAREYKRLNRRVATIKHASHPAMVDRDGTDTWRHFHEGSAERTMIVSPDTRVLFERATDDTDPETLARRYMGEVDLVLVEGFKRAPLPKVEVYRTAVAATPLYREPELDASTWIAIVTDDPDLEAECPVLRFQDTMWLQLLANLVWAYALVIPE